RPPVHPIRVGPVGLYRNSREILLFQQPLRDSGPLPVKLMSAMAGFAEQHDPRITDELQQKIVVTRRSRQWVNHLVKIECGSPGGHQYPSPLQDCCNRELRSAGPKTNIATQGCCPAWRFRDYSQVTEPAPARVCDAYQPYDAQDVIKLTCSLNSHGADTNDPV